MNLTEEQQVNVPFDVYRIRIEITEKGSKIEAGPEVLVGKRDRRTCAKRWEQPDEDNEYEAKDLDRSVVAEDQIRLIAKNVQGSSVQRNLPRPQGSP